MNWNGLLGIATSWADFIKNHEGDGSGNWSWLTPLLNVLSTVLWVALAIVGAAGAVYAVYVGVKMARADSGEAREENKKRLINIIVSIVVTIALIIFFNTFLPMILDTFIGYKAADPDGGGTALRLLLHM